MNPKIRAFAQFGDAHLPSSTLYIPFTQRIQRDRNTPVSIVQVHCLYINCKSSLGPVLKYSHSTTLDPLRKNKMLRDKLKSRKGNWLLLMENENRTKELIIVTSNYN